MYCQSCGECNQDQVLYCVKCGTGITEHLSTEKRNYRPSENSEAQYAYGKHPAVAMILSLLIVGLGQLYEGV